MKSLTPSLLLIPVLVGCSPEAKLQPTTTQPVETPAPPATDPVPAGMPVFAPSESETVNSAVTLAKVDRNLLRFLEPKSPWDDAANVTPSNDGWKRDGATAISPGYRAAQFKKFDYLAAKLPERAHEPREVGFGRFERFQLKIAPRGANADASLELHEGRAVYRDVWPSTDVITVVSNVVYEEMYLLRDANAPRTFTWQIDLPRGITEVKSAWDGGLLFNDSNGKMVLHLPNPYAIDARGTKSSVGMGWQDGELLFTVAANDLQFPVLLDPALETAVWEQKSPVTLPSARFAHAMTYDSSRDVAVLFGGAPSTPVSTRLNDTWEWDGTDWAEISPSATPPERYQHAMAFDTVHSVSILFGGYGPGPLDGTWNWDGNNWEQALTLDDGGADGGVGVPVPGPARAAHGMAFNTATQRTLLFGGGYSDETWAWDGLQWEQFLPATSVLGVAFPAMAYDSARSRTVLFGGMDDTQLRYDDTHEWNGSDWLLRSPEISPSPRHGSGIAYDSVRERTVLFAGSCSASCSDTWEWDGTAWRDSSPASSPSDRSLHAMTFVAQDRRVLLFGGVSGTTSYGDTWEYYTRGGACTNSDDCDTDYCVDGVCCETACDGECEACDLVAGPGVCNPVTDAEDADSCPGPDTCGPEAHCGLPNAGACEDDPGCASQHCSNGYCCDTACDGPCDVCDGEDRGFADASNGACIVGPATFAGAPTCAPYLCTGTEEACPTSCTSDEECAENAFCSADNACRGEGVQCAGDAECAVNEYCLNDTCVPDEGNGGPCAVGDQCQSNLCVGGACQACLSELECADSEWCDEGVCVPDIATGLPCGGPAHCLSTFCVDGVCCDTPCLDPDPNLASFVDQGDKLCQACSAAKKGEGEDGVCGAIVRGRDPDDDCKPDPGSASVCASDPFCDGNRGCTCAQEICAPDGHTKITASDEVECAPYRCVGDPDGECLRECESSADCIEDARCNSQGKCLEGATVDESSANAGCSCKVVGRASTEQSNYGFLSVLLAIALRRRHAGRISVIS